MSEVNQSQLHPIDHRVASYEFLFAGEIPTESTTDTDIDRANMSMAGLCRATVRHTGQYPRVLRRRLDDLPHAIDDILEFHDAQAREGDEKAIFAFTDDQHRQLVGGLVCDVLKQWEITRSKNSQGPLVSTAIDAKRWLVVETAAAIMSAANKYNGFDIQKNKSDQETLVKVISCWGPEFSRQWFNGDILSTWFAARQMPPEEQMEWHATFSPFMRKRFVASSILNPLAALERVKYHLEFTLSDENIAAYLDWDTELTAEAFTGTVRKRLALSNISDPLKACQDWVNGEKRLGEKRDKALNGRLINKGVI
ncbi:MAG TPA: hypothetical protein VF733_03710 [Candidatus Saccharimonadales bacterium]